MHTALIILPCERIARGKKALEKRHFEVFTASTCTEGLAWLRARPTIIFIDAEIENNRFLSEVDGRFSTVVICPEGLEEGPWLESTLEAIGLRSELDSISSGRYDDSHAKLCEV